MADLSEASDCSCTAGQVAAHTSGSADHVVPEVTEVGAAVQKRAPGLPAHTEGAGLPEMVVLVRHVCVQLPHPSPIPHTFSTGSEESLNTCGDVMSHGHAPVCVDCIQAYTRACVTLSCASLYMSTTDTSPASGAAPWLPMVSAPLGPVSTLGAGSCVLTHTGDTAAAKALLAPVDVVLKYGTEELQAGSAQAKMRWRPMPPVTAFMSPASVGGMMTVEW